MAFFAVPWKESVFLEMYPQFQSGCPDAAGYVTSEQLALLWELAVSIVGNSESSAMIPYDPQSGVYKRKIVLYALMCHLATLALWDENGQQGTLTSASEGSVSTGFHIPTIPGGITAQWYNQTQCGRTVWMLLRKYSLGGRYYGINYIHPFG